MEAATRTQALDLPLPHPHLVPEPVVRIREQVDWQAFLPAHARTSLRWRLGQVVKRVIDIAGSAIGLVVLMPLLIVIGVLVRITSKGPVLYRSKYLGRYAHPFVGYKFRTMVANADDLKASMAHLNHMHGPAFKIRNDPRVTLVGRFLRKYSLDELPQLWSVFKGDMSLVGPRPPLPEEFEQYQAWHRGKLAITPGITCFWQINGRSDIHDFDEWMRLDLKYIEKWSLWTDFKILARTIPAVLRGHGAY
jgi:lipopolysaccharide/colanic/teichoic acid biosynthesis glycosyltransferase